MNGEKWWVTAAVAVGAALLGSFVGAGASFRANVALENRRRKALSEIRRKAKVYTPIREELVALRRAITEDRHLGYNGIERERPRYQTLRQAAVLVQWSEFVEDGRANTTASVKVRAALDRVEEVTDSFNEELLATRAAFKESGDVIAQRSGFSPPVTNWYQSELRVLLRHGVRESRVFANPFGEGLADPAPAALTPEQQEFVTLWDADDSVRNARTRLLAAERMLGDATDVAIKELDAAMKRIADKYEHEPD